MGFLETIERVKTYLQHHQRLSFRAIRREFELDEDDLNELVSELVEVQQVAVCEGTVLVSMTQEWINPATEITPPTSTPPTTQPANPLDKERRQLSVLFCDLVGSTELSTRLDPEDLSETMHSYLDAATQVVTRFGGHIAQHLGDGLLVYFGYPQAQEDSAEQAVRAALSIVDAVNGLGRGLSVRVGLDTGLCVLRDVGSGNRRETLALGETPNVAARVQATASSGSVLISAATHRLVAGWFIVEAAGTHQLKGLSEPMVLYRVLRASAVRNQLEARSQRGLTPLIGRKAEQQLLWQRWLQARRGEGQMILITGEPGIGKSRLVRAFKERLADDPHLWLECAGSPYHRHTPFYAIAEMLRQGSTGQGNESVDDRIQNLEQSLTLAGLPLSEALPLITPLLGLPLPERYTPLLLLPDAQRKRTLETLLVWLCGATRMQPIVMVTEDLHWADPSSLELLELLAKEVSHKPILILSTARPEFRTPWPLLAHHAQVALARLSAEQIQEMVKHLANQQALTAELIEALIARTEGVPLFVEELSTAVLEEPDLQADPEHAFPSTLHDSFIARLDRLGTAKQVAQIVAVSGRQCSYGLLRAVASLNEADLQAALRQLTGAELLYQHGQPPQANYVFKHALIRDAAYESLLKRRRQALHGEVFQALARQDDEAVELEVIAQHAETAGLVTEALTYYERAGTYARTRSAHIEAVTHLHQAITLLKTLPANEAQRAREVALQLALGGSLTSTRGFGHPDLEAAFARARTLCDQAGNDPRLATALLGLSMAHSVRGEAQEGAALANRVLHLAEEIKAPALLIAAHGRMAFPLYFQGRFSASLAHAEQALAIYQESGIDRQATQMLDQDCLVTANVWMAWNLWHLGYPSRALEAAEQALDLARNGAYPLALGAALAWQATLYGWRGDMQLLRERASELIALSDRQSMPLYLGLGKTFIGWSQIGTNPAAAVITISESSKLIAQTGNLAGKEMLTRLLAVALRGADRGKDAIRELDTALSFAGQTGMHGGDAELYRLRAEILRDIDLDSKAQTETDLQRALQIARVQEAKSFELCAATSLAGHWQQQNKAAEAYALLAPVYEWFTEGFDTYDLRQASALLNELS